MPCAANLQVSLSMAPWSSAKARWMKRRCSTSARKSARARARRSISPSIRSKARRSAPSRCPMRWPCSPSPNAAACFMPPICTWTRSRSAPAIPTASCILIKVTATTSVRLPKPKEFLFRKSRPAFSTVRVTRPSSRPCAMRVLPCALFPMAISPASSGPRTRRKLESIFIWAPVARRKAF